MDLTAPVLTLVLGFLAGWIAIHPPQQARSRVSWILAFAILTLIAIFGTYRTSKNDSLEKQNLLAIVKTTKSQTELLFSQNTDLHGQIDHLGQLLKELRPQLEPNGGSSGCLKSDTQALLARINNFLKDRLAKSPAYDPKTANDPDYSSKEEA